MLVFFVCVSLVYSCLLLMFGHKELFVLKKQVSSLLSFFPFVMEEFIETFKISRYQEGPTFVCKKRERGEKNPSFWVPDGT